MPLPLKLLPLAGLAFAAQCKPGMLVIPIISRRRKWSCVRERDAMLFQKRGH